MQTSFLYHMMGVADHECTHIEYKHGGSILHIQTRKDKICCPKCGNKDFVYSGRVTREFKSLPMGNRPVTLRKTVHRIHCRHCDCTVQEGIPFSKEKCQYTKRLGRYVQDLCMYMTIKAVANNLGMSWNTVKDINKERLKRKYGRPDLHGLWLIGIDEFAVKKGHVYMTVVVDLGTGRVVYVGDGKGKDALDGFWKRLSRSRCRIEAVSTDLSGAFISAVREHLPNATLIFDHFHVVKLANDALDRVRIDTYKSLDSKEKTSAIKGLRWVLLGNGQQLGSEDANQRLRKALSVNAELSTSYYLKEDLRRVWSQADKESAKAILHNWIMEAKESGVRHMKNLADTIELHSDGIWHIMTIGFQTEKWKVSITKSRLSKGRPTASVMTNISSSESFPCTTTSTQNYDEPLFFSIFMHNFYCAAICSTIHSKSQDSTGAINFTIEVVCCCASNFYNECFIF